MTPRTAAIPVLSIAALLSWSPAARAEDPLDTVLERIDLVDMSLGAVVRFLGEETGVNLVASEEASKRRISALLQGLTVRQTIETLAKTNGLWYRVESDSGVVRIMTAEEFEQDLVLFREQETRVFTLLYPNARDVALAIKNLFGDRVRLGLDDSEQFRDFDELSQRFQRFDLLENRAQSLGIFAGGGSNVFGAGQNAAGSAFLRSNSPGFNQNLATTTARGEDETTGVFDAEQLGRQLTPEQLEALNEAIEAGGGQGVDPALLARLRGGQSTIFVSVMRRHNKLAVRSSDRDAVSEIERLVAALDVPTPQVLLEIRVLAVELDEDFQSVFDLEYDGGSDDVSFSTGSIAGGSGLVDPTALVYRFVNDRFQARLQLLETRGRVTTLATPLLLVANNEVARLFVGEERPIVRNVATQTTVNQTTAFSAASPTIEVRPVGTTLLLAPNVNADRTVTLRILQETSTVKEDDAEIPVPVDNSGALQPFPIDVVAARTVNATVVAKDGHTIALGGLIEEGVTRSRSGVPLLMDIPVLGFFFRRDKDVRTRSELVVLIKPMVLFTAEEGQARTRALTGRLALHPSAATLGEQPLETFHAREVPGGEAGPGPLKQLLKLQSTRPVTEER